MISYPVQNQFQMNWRSQWKIRNFKTARGKPWKMQVEVINTFLNRDHIAHEIKRIGKWVWIKFKSFSTAKETINRIKRKPRPQKTKNRTSIWSSNTTSRDIPGGM
jgi:hypothetical protein